MKPQPPFRKQFQTSIFRSFAPLLLLFVLALASCTESELARLRHHGVEEKATIAFKSESSRGRKAGVDLVFTLYYFAKDSAALAEDKRQKEIISDTTRPFLERFEDWKPMGGGVGKFMSTDHPVSEEIFNRHAAGESVVIVYLPEAPEVVMLKEEMAVK